MNARKRPGANEDPLRAEHAEAARQQKLDALLVRDTALSELEIAELNEVFPAIVKTHFARVWRVLTRRGVHDEDRRDLTQRTFAAYFKSVCREGFPRDPQAKLDSLAAGIASNHRRRLARAPLSFEMPSSSSERPLSGPDLARMMDGGAFRKVLWAALTPEQQAVVEAVVERELSQHEAARELGIPRTTVSSRLEAALRIARPLAAEFFPPSQQ